MAPNGYDAELAALSKAVTDMLAAEQESGQLTGRFSTESALSTTATYTTDFFGLGSFTQTYSSAREAMVRTMRQINTAIAAHANALRGALLLYQRDDEKNRDAVMRAGCE
jgi:hypothetical protein